MKCQSPSRSDQALKHFAAASFSRSTPLQVLHFTTNFDCLVPSPRLIATMLFATACGLHAMRPPSWRPKKSTSILPPPETDAEARRRFRVWWMVFATNRLGAAAEGTPIDFPDEDIETAWDLDTYDPQVSPFLVDEFPPSHSYSNDTRTDISNPSAPCIFLAVGLPSRTTIAYTSYDAKVRLYWSAALDWVLWH